MALFQWLKNMNQQPVVHIPEEDLLAIEAVPRFDITEIQTEDLPLSQTETTFRVLY